MMQLNKMTTKQQGFTIIELVVVILLLGILAATALPRFIDVTTQAHTAAFEATAGSFVTGTALYRAEWVARGQPATGTSLASYNGLQVAPGFATDEANYTPGETGPDELSEYAQQTVFTGRASGYPYSLSSVANLAAYTSARCVEVFNGLLQTGAPTIVAATPTPALTRSSTAADIRAAVADAQEDSAADFQAFTVADIQVDTGFQDNSNETTARNPSGGARNHQQNAPGCVYAYSAEAENNNRFVLYVPWNGRVATFTSADDLATALARFDGPAVP